MDPLRRGLIRLAHEKPELREHLLPILAKTADSEQREAGKSPVFQAKLNALRKEQEAKALAMVQDGKSEAEVRAFLGGIGQGELRVNYPNVFKALQIALSNYRRRYE